MTCKSAAARTAAPETGPGERPARAMPQRRSKGFIRPGQDGRPGIEPGAGYGARLQTPLPLGTTPGLVGARPTRIDAA